MGGPRRLGGVVAGWASQYSVRAAFALPLAVCGLFGLAQGLVIAYARLAPFIVTPAGLRGPRGLMLALSGEGADTYPVRLISGACIALASVAQTYLARLRLVASG